MSKDRTPAEIRAARKRKERRRATAAAGWWLLWLTLFTIGGVIESQALMWASWAAITVELVLIYGLHEKALRKITGRPEVDYQLLHRLEKAERKAREKEQG